MLFVELFVALSIVTFCRCFFCFRSFVPDTPSEKGTLWPHRGRMLIGRFTSPRISPGRPHCVIPYKKGLWLDGSIIIPQKLLRDQAIPSDLFGPFGNRSFLRSHRAEDPLALHLRKVTGGLHIQLSIFRKEYLSLYFSDVDVFCGKVSAFSKNFIKKPQNHFSCGIDHVTL